MRRLAALLLLLPLLAPGRAFGGAQQYEPLANAVRQRMSTTVSDRAPPAIHFKSSSDAQRWLAEMEGRLERDVPDRKQRMELLRTIHYEASRAGLDPQLVLGVIEVESRFRKYAVSRAGARGFMQVMPFWIGLIGQPQHNLFNLRTNVAYGCTILRHYLDVEKGDYWRALGRYNGTLGRGEYPNLVLAAWKGRWKYEGPTA